MVVKLMGGLGNQMFVYAFAKALQMEGCEVVIDRSAFKTKMGGGITQILIRTRAT